VTKRNPYRTVNIPNNKKDNFAEVNMDLEYSDIITIIADEEIRYARLKFNCSEIATSKI